MGIFNNYIHLLSLSLFAACISTSWTADIKANEYILRNILQNNYQYRKTQTVGISKQVDQRISDIVAENVLHFGHNVGLELAALDPYITRNEIFSPLSLMAALSLLTLGAKGQSYEELKQILGLDSDRELIYNPNKYHEEFGLMLNDLQHTNVNIAGVNKRPNANWRFSTLKQAPIRSSSRIKGPVEHTIKVANGLFVQNSYSINPDYSQVVQSIYETEFAKLDFKSRSTDAIDYINGWVNKATFGKIPQIIKDQTLDQSTKVILASALYFKAFWETPFFFRGTTEDDFYPDGVRNPPIKVQMMAAGGIYPFYNAKEYDCRIIGLPYKGNETTMYIIQPNNSSRQRLRDLQHVLDAHKINRMIDNMERKTTVMVFPKMHFIRTMAMKKILQAMNVRDVFAYGYSDLSLIGQMPQRSYAVAQTAAQAPFVEQNHPLAQSAPKKPAYQNPRFKDRYDEPALILSSRFGDVKNSATNTNYATKNNTTKLIAVLSTTEELSRKVANHSNKREKSQVSNFSSDIASLSLSNLESYRQRVDSYKSDLYVNDVVHTVDFSVDEQGTEAAAATITYLHRSGPDVVFRGDTPFLIVIRHDPTKLPLFYGIINKPEL